MRLPGKSGLEVLHALRARGFERPVLVLTAQDAVDAKVDGAARRRRRLRHQAVRVRGAARARRGARASPARARVADAERRRSRARPGHARGHARRRADRAHAEGIHGARVSHAARRPRDEPNADHRVRVGLSLRSRHEHRGRRDQPPAQEDRREAPAAADHDRARRRLHDQGRKRPSRARRDAGLRAGQP